LVHLSGTSELGSMSLISFFTVLYLAFRSVLRAAHASLLGTGAFVRLTVLTNSGLPLTWAYGRVGYVLRFLFTLRPQPKRDLGLLTAREHPA
jgi:hypothetical protein